MTTTEISVRACRRCHGSGHDPEGPAYNTSQERLLDQLGKLGAERGPLVARRAYMRTDGRAALDKIYVQARKLIERGERAGIRQLDMVDALGVSSAAYYKIKSGQTGG
jgi:hypothetical protein